MNSPVLKCSARGVAGVLVVLAAVDCIGVARAADSAFPPPNFTAPFQAIETSLPLGSSSTPRSLMIAHFDGDSHRDILTVSVLEHIYPEYYETRLTRLAGDGHGGFNLSHEDLDGFAAEVTTGDFNADGISDVVLVKYDEIAIGLYDHDGKVRWSRIADTENDLLLASADFNGDGREDFVAVNRSSSLARVFLGKGDGTFDPLADVATVKWPDRVLVADLDGDGDRDLLISNLLISPCAYPNASVYLNDSHGVFTVSARPIGMECVAPLGLFDFDRDGQMDLLEAYGVRHGNGDGTFASRMPFVQWITGGAAGDFDEDGILDLATVDGFTLRILRGVGDGVFTVSEALEAGDQPSLVFAGDLNEDGHLDLTVQSRWSSCIGVLLGDGRGHFGGPAGIHVAGGPSALSAIDLNRDGSVDLVVAVPGSNAIVTLGGRGDGSFSLPVVYETGLNPASVTTGDLDGDGLSDVVVANYGSGSISVFAGTSDGALGPRVDYQALQDVSSVAIGDVDEDGLPDLVAASDVEILVLRNAGTGFVLGFSRSVGVLSPVALADWDGDGHLDLVASPNTVLGGVGDGTFPGECEVCYPCWDSGEPCYYSCTTGDMNQDCVADLAYGVNWYPFRGGRFYAVGVRMPSSWISLSGTPNHAPGALAIGDFDGDGRADLAVAQREGIVSVFFNDGTALNGRIDVGTGRVPSSIAVADFDGDGRLDFATACSGSNAIFVHLNSHSTAPPPPALRAQSAIAAEASIVLSWNRPASPIAGYKIYYGLAGDGSPLAGDQATEGASPIAISADRTSFALNCLTDSKFALRVAAVDALGRESPCLPLLEAVPQPLGGEMRFAPDTDAASGRWLILSLALHQGHESDQILIQTIRLNGVGPPSQVGLGSHKDELKIRFPREAVEAAMAHGLVELTGRVLGCRDTLSFVIRDTLDVKAAAVTAGLATVEGTAPESNGPKIFALRPIFPNPVSGSCEFAFDLPQVVRARLRVFDLTGRQVALVLDELMPRGYHRMRWETARVPNGLYFLKLEAGGFIASQRLAIVRH